MQVGPERDPTRDYTQQHHIPLGGTREGPWAAQEASPWPSPLVDSQSWDRREEYFLRLGALCPLEMTMSIKLILHAPIYAVTTG